VLETGLDSAINTSITACSVPVSSGFVDVTAPP
jgi:hypothetical protein